MDRLTTVASPMYGTTGANYAYNVLDDLVHVNIGGAKARNQHYCYDTNRHLRTIRSGSCGGSVATEQFDVQGNLASREPAGGAEQGYRFDYGNRLREVDGVERYRYDGHGRRVLAMNFVSGTVLSQYGLDGKLLYQKSDRTLLQTDHVYLGNTLVAIHERPASGTGPEPVKYQHTDGLGSPVVVTRQDRSRAEESEYEPYGQVINRAMRDGPGYTGHVEDAATGLVYMQQRYYDPKLGVFLSTDPVTAYSSPISQFHRYRYANNNPYSLIDPDGRRASGDDQKTTGSHLRRSEVAQAMQSNGRLSAGDRSTAGEARTPTTGERPSLPSLSPGVSSSDGSRWSGDSWKEVYDFTGNDKIWWYAVPDQEWKTIPLSWTRFLKGKAGRVPTLDLVFSRQHGVHAIEMKIGYKHVFSVFKDGALVSQTDVYTGYGTIWGDERFWIKQLDAQYDRYLIRIDTGR